MKDISKISKTFSCDCGILNKFEFETDLDIHSISISAKCQSCGKENIISLENFFRKTNDTASSAAAVNYSDTLPTNVNVSELIESPETTAASEESVSGESSEDATTVQSVDNDEDLTYDEKEAFSDLFGKL